MLTQKSNFREIILGNNLTEMILFWQRGFNLRLVKMLGGSSPFENHVGKMIIYSTDFNPIIK